MTQSLELLDSSAVFNGEIRFYKFKSEKLNSETKFSLFLPDRALRDMKARDQGKNCTGRTPYILCLAGLTCNETTFLTKSDAVRFASEKNIALVTPDTSPRNVGLKHEDPDCWWIGEGAGAYLNATKAPWSTYYKMYDYVSEELPALLAKEFWLDNERKSLIGHSMGGMGALNFGLRQPEKWRCVSVFAPVANPSNCSWGQDFARNYLQNPEEEGKKYDPTLLLEAGHTHPAPILYDQGREDNFLHEHQLLPKNFLAAAEKAGQQVIFRAHKKFDHSYWFVQSFIESHIDYHALYLSNDAAPHKTA